MGKYDYLTPDEFDRILAEIVKENAGCILTIPGIYEILSEYWNNEVLDRWDSEQFEEDDLDPADLGIEL